MVYILFSFTTSLSSNYLHLQSPHTILDILSQMGQPCYQLLHTLAFTRGQTITFLFIGLITTLSNFLPFLFMITYLAMGLGIFFLIFHHAHQIPHLNSHPYHHLMILPSPFRVCVDLIIYWEICSPMML